MTRSSNANRHGESLGLAALALCLVACQPSGAQNSAATVTASPSAQDRAAAFHPSYQATSGSRSECLGRLVFEVPGGVGFEWGTPRQFRTNEAYLGFSRILQGGQDAVLLGNVAVLVVSNATPKTISEMRRLTGLQKSMALQDFDENIRIKSNIAQDRVEAIETPEVKASSERTAALQKDLQAWRDEITDHQRRRQNLERDWHPTDWGLPDSTGYIAGPTLYAFLLRGGYAFQFMSTGGEGEPPFEQRLSDFKDLLSRFEFRPQHQVPTKPGLCIPHGFVADDGRGHFRAEVSYRFTDAPGVIYTLATAVEGERDFNPNEPLLEATARASVAGLIGNSQGRRLQVLGPKSVEIGARAGVLGGLHTTQGVPLYSVYAGLRGWDHVHELPFISLNMRAFDRATVPGEIKVDPPPFATSWQRFEITLKSLRTRRAPL